MAFTSTIKPYKFVNPSSISSRGGGATIIAGGKTITGGVTSQVKSARVTMLAINRIGMAMEGLGKTQQQIRDIIVYENKYLAQTTSFRKKREGYRRDQKSEQQSESFGQKEQESVAKEVQKKEKKKLGWLEKIFGPFAGIISFVGRFVISQTILRWMGDGKNTDKLVVFVKSFSKVFKWAFNIAYKSTDAVLTGFAKVFGSSDKKGLDRFGEVLGGLGQLLIGIAGFKALGYLLNPFSLVNDIIGLVDLLSARGGGGPGGGTSGPGGGQQAKPQLGKAAQKIGENYGDDAARYYDDLVKRGKKPGAALNEVRSKFKKLPPAPKTLAGKMKQGFMTQVDSLKKFGGKLKGFGLKAFNIGAGVFKKGKELVGQTGNWIKASGNQLKTLAAAAKDPEMLKTLVNKMVAEKVKPAIEKNAGVKKLIQIVSDPKNIGKNIGPVIKDALKSKQALDTVKYLKDVQKNAKIGGIDKVIAALTALFDYGVMGTPFANAFLGAIGGLLGYSGGFALGAPFGGVPGFIAGAAGGIAGEAIGRGLARLLGKGALGKIQDPLMKDGRMLADPELAEGGIVDKPTRAIIGEKGPEAVVPLSKLGGSSAMASTIIGATDSALSRMGAAGEIARSLIDGDLSAAEQAFGATKVSAGGGDSLGKSVRKSIGGKIEAGDGISLLIGDKTVSITDKKNPGNSPVTLRGQLANVLGALIWVANKDIKSGSGSGGTTTGDGDVTADSSNMDAGDFKPGGPMHQKGATIAKKLMGMLGIKDYQAAGIVGNLIQESSLVPDRIQGSGMKRGPLKLDGVTGYSYPQWTSLGRQQAFAKYMESKGFDWRTKGATDAMATGFLAVEFKQAMSSRFKNTKNAAEASNWTLFNYERPADQGAREQKERAHDSQKVLEKMSEGGQLQKKPSSFMSRERKAVVQPQLSKANQLPKYAAGGSHRVIPDTPSTSWAAGIPLTYVTSKSGKRAEVAVPLAKRFQGFINDLEATGYKINELGGFRPDGPPPGNVDGKGPQYAHPYGAAIDINWTKNPAFVGKRFGDFPSNSGQIAAKYGLGWGSKFDDAMHFSAMKREYGTGIGGQEITGKTLGGSKEGADFKPGQTNSSGQSLASATPEEPQKDPFQALEEAINKLNSTLGYKSPENTTTEGTKPSTTQIAFGKNTPQLAATGSSAAAAKGVNDMSTAVNAMKEASESAQSTNVIPLPINTSVNTAAAFAAPQVIYPRTPITFSI